jgi:D-3-phosphoglycerate dehydrogenase
MASARVVLIERDERIEPDIELAELVGIDCELISTAVDSEGEVIEAIAGAVVVLDSSLPMPRRVIETLDGCRLIVRMGHGYEGVDLEAATGAGIMVANTAGATSEEVSNHALALLLSLARRLYELDPGVRQGRWGELWARDACSQIWDETLGIFGFGHIGRAMARKANALRMEVIACDPYVGPWADLEEGVSLVSFDELLERSDFISIHSAYTPESHHAFDAEAFRKMKPRAYLINTARGPVVDEQALVEALRSSEIAGAGVDVFDSEPADRKNPLLALDNVIVTPHVAGSSPGGWERIRRSAARDAARVLRGEIPHSLVNPEVLSR